MQKNILFLSLLMSAMLLPSCNLRASDPVDEQAKKLTQCCAEQQRLNEAIQETEKRVASIILNVTDVERKNKETDKNIIKITKKIESLDKVLEVLATTKKNVAVLETSFRDITQHVYRLEKFSIAMQQQLSTLEPQTKEPIKKEVIVLSESWRQYASRNLVGALYGTAFIKYNFPAVLKALYALKPVAFISGVLSPIATKCLLIPYMSTLCPYIIPVAAIGFGVIKVGRDACLTMRNNITDKNKQTLRAYMSYLPQSVKNNIHAIQVPIVCTIAALIALQAASAAR